MLPMSLFSVMYSDHLSLHTDMALACRADALKVRAEKAESYGQKMHRLLQVMRVHLEAAQKQQEAPQQQAQSQQRQDEQQNNCSLKAELSEAKQAIAAVSMQAQSSQVYRPLNMCNQCLAEDVTDSVSLTNYLFNPLFQMHMAAHESVGCRKELPTQRGSVSNCRLNSPMSKRSALRPGTERLKLKRASRCDCSLCLLCPCPNPT